MEVKKIFNCPHCDGVLGIAFNMELNLDIKEAAAETATPDDEEAKPMVWGESKWGEGKFAETPRGVDVVNMQGVGSENQSFNQRKN